MKKQNSKKTFLLIIGLFIVVGLVILGVAASVFAYRQFIFNDEMQFSVNTFTKRSNEDAQSPQNEGVVVIYVDPNSPAADAGIHRGMIILEVEGQAVKNPSELRQAILKHEAGDEITLTVLDGEEREEIKATLASAGPYLGVDISGDQNLSSTESFDEIVPLPEEFDEFFHDYNGRGFRFILPENGRPEFPRGRILPDRPREFPSLPDDLQMSLMITSIVPDSPAEAADLAAGDMILEINGDPIDRDNSVAEMIGDMNPGQEVALKILRNGETKTITVTLSEHSEKEERGYLGIYLAPALFSREFFFEEDRSR